jgi:hypothetical protein
MNTTIYHNLKSAREMSHPFFNSNTTETKKFQLVIFVVLKTPKGLTDNAKKSLLEKAAHLKLVFLIQIN